MDNRIWLNDGETVHYDITGHDNNHYVCLLSVKGKDSYEIGSAYGNGESAVYALNDAAINLNRARRNFNDTMRTRR